MLLERRFRSFSSTLLSFDIGRFTLRVFLLNIFDWFFLDSFLGLWIISFLLLCQRSDLLLV